MDRRPVDLTRSLFELRGPGSIGPPVVFGGDSCSRAPAGVVGCYGESVQFAEELFALTEEEPVSSEACNRRHGAAELIGQWANDRDVGELGADEFTRDGEDKAWLNQARWL